MSSKLLYYFVFKMKNAQYYYYEQITDINLKQTRTVLVFIINKFKKRIINLVAGVLFGITYT